MTIDGLRGPMSFVIWYAVETPAIPVPSMAMSHSVGSCSDERYSSISCGCVRQYEIVASGTGKICSLDRVVSRLMSIFAVTSVSMSLDRVADLDSGYLDFEFEFASPSRRASISEVRAAKSRLRS